MGNPNHDLRSAAHRHAKRPNQLPPPDELMLINLMNLPHRWLQIESAAVSVRRTYWRTIGKPSNELRSGALGLREMPLPTHHARQMTATICPSLTSGLAP